MKSEVEILWDMVAITIVLPLYLFDTATTKVRRVLFFLALVLWAPLLFVAFYCVFGDNFIRIPWGYK